MTETRKLRVFLCHSSQDKPIVRELYQRLNAEGWIDPWLDKEKLLPGQDWDLEINKAVESSEAVIVFLSKNSVSKEGYVQKEITKVLDVAEEKPDGTLFIIPLRLDDCQIPRRLAKWQYEDYFPAEQQGHACERLLLSLSARFSQVNSRNDNSQLTYLESNSFIRWNEKWIEKHHTNAQSGMKRNKFDGFLEIKFSLANQKLNVSQKELLLGARKAQIHTFGWPIGIVLDTPDSNPKPQTDGIKAEVEFQIAKTGGLIKSYDYWTLGTNGDFYLLKSLFEDSESHFKNGTVILFDTRIHRTTEILLYCQRLYNEIGVDPAARVNVEIRLGGLRGRHLSSTTNRFFPRMSNACSEDEINKVIQLTLADITPNLVRLVKEFVAPLFLLFDFQEFDDSIYEEIVSNYANGEVV